MMVQIDWLVPTVAATACWALSDICCDACIMDESADATKQNDLVDEDVGQKPKPVVRIIDGVTTLEVIEDKHLGLRLTSEQDALLSAAVSLVCGVATLLVIRVTKPWFEIFIIMIAGCIHFTAYYSTLSAYKTESSTVITPLMQLSAVFLLAATVLANLFGLREVPIHSSHFFAIVLIFIGGFLPAAQGDLNRLFSFNFYRKPAVRAVLMGEFLICCYNILLHYCTHADSSRTQSVLQFFALSRIGNFLACALRVGLMPSLQQQVKDLHKVDLRFFKIGIVGECLSVLGVCIVTFSYAMFYEPAVVNAAEGGIQQLLNLCFAVIARSCSFGRKVENPTVKFVSFALVSSGLVLSVF